MFAQERSGDSTLQDEMELLNAELDRIDKLLRSAAETARRDGRDAHLPVPELLLTCSPSGRAALRQPPDPARVCARTRVPPAAIPPRRSSRCCSTCCATPPEALQPGQRLVVLVLPHGQRRRRNCLEIRSSINGPGLPVERAQDPLTPRPSAKGAEHQASVSRWYARSSPNQGRNPAVPHQAGAGTSFRSSFRWNKAPGVASCGRTSPPHRSLREPWSLRPKTGSSLGSTQCRRRRRQRPHPDRR